MLRSLRVSNYRGLREFRMDGLTRVNLLVGTNNCGKTTALEAVHMLSAGSVGPLVQSLIGRGEVFDERQLELDVACLLHGRDLDEQSGFEFESEADGSRLRVDATVVARQTSMSDDVISGDNISAGVPGLDEMPPLSLELRWHKEVLRGGVLVPITRRGGIRPRDIGALRLEGGVSRPTVMLRAGDRLGANLQALFERIVLTPDETTVVNALKIIDPDIERVASLGSQHQRGAEFAMMVGGRRIPMGSMGDGISRLFGISLALVTVKGGVLLVDEIDTGLHYSVLVDMWRLVLKTARDLDVQVFATTHSRDCYEALAAVATAGNDEISLHRIERGKEAAVRFSEAEILQAAERGLEVR